MIRWIANYLRTWRGMRPLDRAIAAIQVPYLYSRRLTNSVYLTLRQRWARGAVVHGVR